MATDLDFETADELRDVLATLLAGAAGGTKRKWRGLVGPVERLPTWKYVRFNWQVNPNGDDGQRELIIRAADLVRAERPYIT